MKKRILLTGGTGLIGKNLVEFLKKKYLIKSFGSEINLKNEIEVKKLFSSTSFGEYAKFSFFLVESNENDFEKIFFKFISELKIKNKKVKAIKAKLVY